MSMGLGIGLGLVTQSQSSPELGPDLVTNGTFDADTDWTKGAGWTIGSGVITATGAISSTTFQAGGLVSGTTYRLDWDITAYTEGVAAIGAAGAVIGYWTSAIGSYSEDVVAATNGNVEIKCSGFTGSIDNVVVREVL